jgi:outer membrane protein assembly factor BamB
MIMEMQPIWERTLDFRGEQPLLAGGLLITQQIIGLAGPSVPEKANIAVSAENGEIIWRITPPGFLQGRMIADGVNYYYISYNNTNSKYSIASASFMLGRLNWITQEVDELISSLFLDGGRITALAWFKKIDGFFIYIINASDGSIVSKTPVPMASMVAHPLLFAGNGSIMVEQSLPQPTIRIFTKPYATSNILLQGVGLTFFKRAMSNRVFYLKNVSTLGLIDLQSMSVKWEGNFGFSINSVIDDDEYVIIKQRDDKVTVYTRSRPADGSIIWRTRIANSNDDLSPSKGGCFEKLFVTGCTIRDGGSWKTKTLGIHLDDGRIVWSFVRQGSAPSWAIASGRTTFVPTANGIAAIDLDRFWRQRYEAFSKPPIMTGGGTIVGSTDGISPRLLGIDLAAGKTKWSRPFVSVCSAATLTDCVYAAEKYALHAIDSATGNDLWVQPAPEGIASVGTAEKLIIYCGADKKLRALDPKKLSHWSQPIDVAEITESGFAYDDKRVYFGDNARFCYGLSSDAYPEESWRQPLFSATAFKVAPVVVGDLVLFADGNGQVIALNRTNGAVIYVRQEPDHIPCVGITRLDDDASVLAAFANGAILRLRAKDQAVLWASVPIGSVRSAAVAINNSVFVGGIGAVAVLDLGTGQRTRMIDLKSPGQGYLIAALDVVLVVDDSGYLQALSPE